MEASQGKQKLLACAVLEKSTRMRKKQRFWRGHSHTKGKLDWVGEGKNQVSCFGGKAFKKWEVSCHEVFERFGLPRLQWRNETDGSLNPNLLKKWKLSWLTSLAQIKAVVWGSLFYEEENLSVWGTIAIIGISGFRRKEPKKKSSFSNIPPDGQSCMLKLKWKINPEVTETYEYGYWLLWELRKTTFFGTIRNVM